MHSGTDNFAFRQNSIHGGTLVAQFNSSTQGCTFYGNCSIPNLYDKSSTDTLISNIYDDVYIKTEIGTLFSNIDLNNYYTKTEIDDLDNDLSTLILNTYNNSETDTCLTNYYNMESINTQFDLNATGSNTYTKQRGR